MFRDDPTSAPAAPDAAPAVSNDPLPKPAAETAATRSTEVEPKVLEPPAAAPSPINEVIPNVSRSAMETIRGTIRVSVRVIVGKDGTVLVATAEEPGPSRYFARLALEASRKWTFAPQDSAEQRVTLVRFYFKRTGTTGHADPLQACKSC
jgi:TonB family protein